MANFLQVKPKSKWKNVAIEPNLLNSKDFSNLISLEELTDYRIVSSEKAKSQNKKLTKTSSPKPKNKHNLLQEKKKNGKNSQTQSLKNLKVNSEKMLKTKKRKKNLAGKKRKVWKDGGLVSGKNVLNLTEAVSQEDQPEVEHPSSSSTKSGKRKSHKGSSESMKKMKVEENQEPIHFQSSKDMSAWKNLFVPPDVLKSLEEQNFISPTPIQALALPSAIRDRLDVVGAAETGSGKTLAFGIPIIHSILKHKEYTGKSLQLQTQEESTDEQEPDTESFEDQESDSSSVEAESEDIDIDTIEKIVSENIDDAELDSDEEFDNPPEEEVIDEESPISGVSETARYFLHFNTYQHHKYCLEWSKFQLLWKIFHPRYFP